MIKRSRLRSLAPDYRVVISGCLIAASAPPWDLSFLCFFALIPWLAALDRAKSGWDAFKQSLWTSIIMSLGVFFWVAYALNEYGGLPWFLCVLGLIAFSLITEPQLLAFGPLRFLALKRIGLDGSAWARLALGLGFGLMYAGLDWVIPKLFTDTYGQIFYRYRPLRQAADIGGAHLLTFVVFEVNEGLWQLWSGIRRGRGRVTSAGAPAPAGQSSRPGLAGAAPQLAASALLLAATWLYGTFRMAEHDRKMEAPHPSVQLAAIQANIGDFDKIAAERGVRGAADKVINTYLSLSDEALSQTPRPEAIIWPETAYPSTFRTPATSTELARDQRVEAWVRDRGVPLLFGGYDRNGRTDFNSLFYLSPSRGAEAGAGALDLSTYHKYVLLPFGEYIPGAESIRWVREQFPQVGFFGRGAGPSVHEVAIAAPLGVLRTGPIICYEALFPDYVIGAARKGSQLILNITNDSWFGPFGEPQLHLMVTSFRGIETRLPQLRATNTGISTLILPDGEITQATPINQSTILNVRVPILEPTWTLMKAWGDWFGPTAFVMGSLLLGALGLSGCRKGRVARNT